MTWAGVGLAAGAAGLGAAQLVAGVVGPAYAPVVALGAVFVDATPGWLKEAAISAFGTHDKQVLLGVAALVAALVCALAGVLVRTRPGSAPAVVVGLGALAAAAAATRPSAPLTAALPSVVGALAGAGALVAVARRGRPAAITGVAPAALPGPARRGVLQAAVGFAAAGGVAAVAGAGVGRALHGADASRAAVKLPPPAAPDPALSSGVEVGVPGVAPFRVPDAQFYRIDTALLAPRVRAQDWTLRLHGMVDREVRLDFADLLAAPLVEHDVTLTCVSNEVGGNLIGNARWLGLPLRTCCAEAGPQPGADMVLSTSADGWTAGPPRSACCSTAGRAAGRRDERATRSRSSTGSRCGWWCRGSTATCRRPSGWSTWR